LENNNKHKRQKTLKESKQEVKTFTFGKLFVLPADVSTSFWILSNIFQYLDIQSLCNVKRSSLIQQFYKEFKSDAFDCIRRAALKLSYKGSRSINEIIRIHPARRLYLLIERYIRDFPRGTARRHRFRIPTPIVCACEHGRMDDVELFVSLHPFHEYITNRDVNGYRDDMTLKDMVSQVGRTSEGIECTPLMVAIQNDHFHLVQYLIEQCDADPNIELNGSNALHFAVSYYRRPTTDLIKILLKYMSLDSINKTDSYGFTPLDICYEENPDGPMLQEVSALIRSKGGKANDFDVNGNHVGRGNGDLNH